MRDLLLDTAEKLYTYAYPIVWTRQALKFPKEGFYNTIHMRTLTKADGVSYKPNNDTLYSMHALQLASTPFVLKVPKLPDERYLLVNILNLKTEDFFTTGSKREQNGAGNYILLYRDTPVPDGYEDYIPVRSDDSLNMLLIRTETFGEEDYQVANTVQDAFDIHAIYPEKLKDTGVPAAISHKNYVAQLTVEEFIREFLNILPETVVEEEVFMWLDDLGIDVDQFHYEELTEEVTEALDQGFKKAYRAIENYNGPALVSNGWKTYVDGVGTFGKNYLLRAFVSWFAWGANLPEDSIYPVLYSDIHGDKFDSTKDYYIRFKKDGLPKAKYFWSLTLYSDPGCTLVPNPDEKYVINSHGLKDLKFEEDGSLQIRLSRKRPNSKEERTNWLPLPETDPSFSLMLRFYGADEDILTGKWEYPIVEQA